MPGVRRATVVAMRVEQYDLFLDIDFRNLKFLGEVSIRLESEDNVVLDSEGLNILKIARNGQSLNFDQKGDSITVKTGAFKGTLGVSYEGAIPDALAGIYKAPYDGTYMITTDFEAANARRMLPCVDHPDFKAEFKVTVRIDKDLDAISNMPIESVDTNGDRKTVLFQKTPRMSTYLLYLGVGKFDELKERVGKVDVVVASTPGKGRKGKFALEVAEESLKFYESYFDIPYALPKIHLIGVAEYAAGAMENWGAITFREIALQIDDKSSVSTRKRAAETISHELAHQWFGNLVTMKWWNDLWLNESFATLMSYKALETTFPQWNTWQDFLISETSGAMNMDSLKKTHAIEADVKSPNEIQQIFDAITYGKGASILRMIEAYVGQESFQKGVQDYLQRYKFSNATGQDFWNCLEQSSGKQISRIMKEWIGKPGHPLVTAAIGAEKLVLRQERFLLSGEYEKSIWPVPITMKLNGQPREFLLDKEEAIISLRDVTSLHLNIDRTGFYRVHYKGDHDLVRRADLSASDKWGIVFDVMAFLVAGKMSFQEYTNLVMEYRNEQDQLPAREVSDQLAFLHIVVNSKIADLSKDFHQSQLQIVKDKTDENSSMLRGIVARRLAIVDDEYASLLAPRFRDHEGVEPDMKEAVAIGYARAYGDLGSILERYRASTTDEERVTLLEAMSMFKDPRLLSKTLEIALSGEVKKQDVISVALAVTRNPDGKQTTWEWIRTNLPKLRQLSEGTGDLSLFFQASIPILGIGRVEELERSFEENTIPEAVNGISAGLEKLRIYQKLVDRISSQT